MDLDENGTYVPADEGLSKIGRRGLRYWQSLSLTTQFLIVATLIVCGSMAIVGEWLSSQIAANQLRSRAESGALYMEGFLAGDIEEHADGPQVSAQRQKELDGLLAGTDLSRRVEEFRIWRRDGTIIYSTDKTLMGKRFPSPDVEEAFAGRVVAQLEDLHDDGEEKERTTQRGSRPLIEIYAPIYRSDTQNVIAVGEIYEDAGEFIAQRNRIQRRTWGIVGATTITIMALLFLIVRRASIVIAHQGAALKNQLKSARALSEQNDSLRKAADRARMDASKSNETLLNRIGSDLHDGPIQLLSLLILRLGGRTDPVDATSATSAGELKIAASDLTPTRLASQVLTELRELSTGLVLPEIENISLEDAFRIAVERHEHTTGSVVTSTYSGLPENVVHSLKICLYRVIQEGLNNAFRHARACDQSVTATADLNLITVVVGDRGPGPGQSVASGPHLGLQGVRHRVEAFGGWVEIRERSGFGTELLVTVPLEGNGAQ